MVALTLLQTVYRRFEDKQEEERDEERNQVSERYQAHSGWPRGNYGKSWGNDSPIVGDYILDIRF